MGQESAREMPITKKQLSDKLLPTTKNCSPAASQWQRLGYAQAPYAHALHAQHLQPGTEQQQTQLPARGEGQERAGRRGRPWYQ